MIGESVFEVAALSANDCICAAVAIGVLNSTGMCLDTMVTVVGAYDAGVSSPADGAYSMVYVLADSVISGVDAHARLFHKPSGLYSGASVVVFLSSEIR